LPAITISFISVSQPASGSTGEEGNVGADLEEVHVAAVTARHCMMVSFFGLIKLKRSIATMKS
jgi:hypothetical protein